VFDYVKGGYSGGIPLGPSSEEVRRWEDESREQREEKVERK